MKVQKMNMTIMVKAITKAKIKCTCGVPIITHYKMYDHDGGVLIEGHDKKQWIYFECHNCGYQYSLKKILQKYRKPLSIIFVALHMEEVMKDE